MNKIFHPVKIHADSKEIVQGLPDAKGADEGGCPQGRQPVAAGTTVDETTAADSPSSANI